MNDDKEIAVYDNTVSAREYLSYIAEQAGGFACVGRDGRLYIKRIGEDVSELDIKYFQNFTWGESFKVSRVAYEDGVQDFKFGEETGNTIWLSQDNMYIVSSKQVENVYDEYRDFECYSFEGATIIDPAYDVGDILVIDGKKVIYQGSMDYVGKFKADISSKIQAKTKEETMVTKVSDKVKIRRVQSSIDQVKGEIETLVEEATETSSKMTEVLQTVDDITQKVSNITDLTNTVTGVKAITIEDAVMGAPVELHIFGNNRVFSGLYFDEDWCFDENHYFTRGNATILMNDVVYDLGVNEVLRQFEGVCDEYVYEYEKGTAKVIRRVGVKENGDLYVLENEVVEDLPVPDFALKDGENVIRLLNDGANMTVTYVVKNDYTSLFATNVRMDSKISQSAEEIRQEVDKDITLATGELAEDMSAISQRADEIDLEVQKKVGANEIISKINQSAEAITIEASRVNLTGLVRATDLSNSGSTVINGANITTGKISSDRIDTTNLRIGGASVSTEIGASSIEWLAGGVPSPSGHSSNPIAYFGAFNTGVMNSPRNSVGCEIWDNGDMYVRHIYTESGSDSNGYMAFVKTPLSTSSAIDAVNYVVGHTSSGSRGLNVNTYAEAFDVYAATSDERLKENIADAEVDALAILNQIRLISFDWKDTGEYEAMGFSAQQLERVCEDFVSHVKQPESSEYDEILQVRDFNVLPYIVGAVQELSRQVEDLRERVESLEKKEEEDG